MKKILICSVCAALALALVFASFTGCAKKDEDISVPSGYSLARSDVSGFYFFFPATVWLESGSGAYVSVVKAASGTDTSNVVVNKWTESVRIGVGEGYSITPEEYWSGIKKDEGQGFDDGESYDGYEKTLTELVQDYAPVEKKNVTVAGKDAYSVVYNCRIAGVDFRIMQVSVFSAGRNTTDVYEFTYTSTPEFYDGNFEAVSAMLDSFVIE